METGWRAYRDNRRPKQVRKVGGTFTKKRLTAVKNQQRALRMKGLL